MSKEKTIGKKIQEWRKKKGLTQDALARKADVPYTTLAKIESDVNQNPTYSTITKIANGLGVSLDELTKE